MTNNLPLSGIRVIALEQAVAAPFCSRQLADMGADVIKVERPDGGDFARDYDRAIKGQSAYFVWLNRGKRSITINLKDENERKILHKLLASADVFIHNLAVGKVEQFGFGYDVLQEINPRLIWCGISGYGPDGPYRDKKAYDLLIQAEAGAISLTGDQRTPAKIGISIADITSGLYAHSSVLAALIQRGRTGKGERIDISMLECLAEWAMPPLNIWQGKGEILERAGLRHNMIVPYGAYQCADGMVIFSIQNEREWARFCETVLQAPQIATDEHYNSNEKRLRHRTQLEALIEQHVSTVTVKEVIARLDAAQIANGALNDIPALSKHPQLAARQRWVDVDTPNGVISALLPPHNLSSLQPNMGRIPALGEHTQEILDELATSQD